MVVAVYPGTFDPLTRGHEDLVRRASGLFDTLVVGVADSKNKRPFFSLAERLEIANEVLGHYPNVKVESFSGLLKDFVREHDARVIVRGLRAVSDFEYEFQMAARRRNPVPDPVRPVPVHLRHHRARDRDAGRRRVQIRVPLGRPLAAKENRFAGGRAESIRLGCHGITDYRRLHQLRRVRARVPERRDLDGRRVLPDRSAQVHGMRRPLRRTAVPAGLPRRLHSVQS
jgi:cytidyltransferase-like protein